VDDVSAQELLAFNRGIQSRYGLARLDLKRTAMSAEIQNNWMPSKLGSMMLRPGLGYTGAHAAKPKTIPFLFAADDFADIEMTAALLRIWVDDALVTRPTVAAAITNGTFAAGIASWTDQDEAGATSGWDLGGYLALAGDGTNHAIRQQQVTYSAADAGKDHAIRVVVAVGPVTMRVGSASLGSQFLADTVLGTGTHSIVIRPNANFFIQFRSRLQRTVLVDTVSIESNAVLSLPTPYAEADLANLRWDQSGDVVYLACVGYQQRKIERRSNGSWSIVLYQPEDGPFRVENVTPTTIAASALTGSAITLTASASLWREGHVGALFSITSVGQRVETSFSAENTFSDPIRVTGVGVSRSFAILISGTFTATVTLQRSVGELGSWEDVTTYTAGTSTSYNDALDNQIIYFRLGVKTGDFTSGSAVTVLNYSAGSITGVARLTVVSSDLLATADVITALGGTVASDVWAEGQWSDHRGWPSSVALHDGRLWWAGKDRFNGSVSDGFESHDPEFEGDAGPISRSIGSGPVDTTSWLLSLNRLFAGTDGSIIECKSTSLDEPLTPTNFTPKRPVTRGCARVAAVKVDDTAIIVERSGRRVHEVSYSFENGGASLSDLTLLAPEVCAAGIVAMAVQREPDTRLHCVLADGTVGVLVFDRAENLLCWVTVETDGDVVDAWVQPGTDEDAVYYSVKRTIGGATVYYREKWALESEARGAAVTKLGDSFIYSSHAANIISGLDHLEGETVVAWGGGKDLGSFVVSGGSITLHASTTYTNRCAGLGYEARFKSSKLAYMAPKGKSALGARSRVDRVGVVLADTHYQGLEYGPDFDHMDPLPLMEEYAETAADTVHEDFAGPLIEFPGEWTTDARLCLKATAPRPCTVLAAVVDMVTNAK
jgi:hypothetical protein